MKPILFSYPDSEFFSKKFVNSFAKYKKNQIPILGKIKLSKFPDGESYIKVQTKVKGHPTILVCSMLNPDQKIPELLFISEALKSMGATQVGLVSPYLPYMRQDKRFQKGEAITSNIFAGLLSKYFSWVVTVDPHLHRHHSLPEIYSIPTRIVHAAPFIAHWITDHVDQPLIVGPDSESEQWISKVAEDANAPYIILKKKRLSSQKVTISRPSIKIYKDHTPILVDDIISTAGTMAVCAKSLIRAKMKRPICMGVHGIFANNAYNLLEKAGVQKIITCNSIQHKTNQIDLSPILAHATIEMLAYCDSPYS